MDLKIRVYKTSKDLLDYKPCFNETVPDVSEYFGYSNLILALKSVFGQMSVIQFCII